MEINQFVKQPKSLSTKHVFYSLAFMSVCLAALLAYNFWAGRQPTEPEQSSAGADAQAVESLTKSPDETKQERYDILLDTTFDVDKTIIADIIDIKQGVKISLGGSSSLVLQARQELKIGDGVTIASAPSPGLRGKDGEPGVPASSHGQDGGKGGNGGKGSDGQRSGDVFMIAGSLDLGKDVKIVLDGAKGGDGGSGGKGGDGGRASAAAIGGVNAGHGGDGGDGGAGGNGGAAGELGIFLVEGGQGGDALDKLTYSAKRGEFGKGGGGGSGGSGGGDHRTLFGRRNAGSPGRTGNSGTPGKTGKEVAAPMVQTFKDFDEAVASFEKYRQEAASK